MLIRAMAGIAVALALGQGVAVAAVTAPGAAEIAHAGNGHGALACGACHGAQGEGQAAAGFPRLAGLNAAYLLRQLDAFAGGTRASPVMVPVAKALDARERKALADYYAALPAIVPGAQMPPAPRGLGEQLALHGRWSTGVPACVACHGPRGEGVGTGFPPLVGQPAGYIASQLQAFKSGVRHNDPLGLMRHVASVLDEQDIKAVSAWFAAQPTRTQRGAP